LLHRQELSRTERIELGRVDASLGQVAGWNAAFCADANGLTFRCETELERTAAERKPDGEGVAVSRAILFDAIFAIVFATMMVTIASFLWALM
jgi:hypothetical protein